MKYLVSNLVYGSVYTDLFLHNHLRSILDPSNLPAACASHEIEYVVFTDVETLPVLETHANVLALKALLPVTFLTIGFEPGADRFNMRYRALVGMFRASCERALSQGQVLSALTADLVCAQGFFPAVLSRMSAGHGAVLMLPPRCAAESVSSVLRADERAALPATELMRLCYENMHPLWTCSHWSAPQFSKLPFVLLWNSGTGVLARTYSVTPIIFRPTQAMLDSEAVIDAEIPSMCENPYWAHDWTDAPILDVEPLFCYYPPFRNAKANPAVITEFSQVLHETQLSYLAQKFWFPSQAGVSLNSKAHKESNEAVRALSFRAQQARQQSR